MNTLTAVSAAVIPALQAAGYIAKKLGTTEDVNRHIDRSVVVKELFDAEKADEAYQKLYAEIQYLCAVKGITPSIYYEGAPCINIPLANLIELMDAATK